MIVNKNEEINMTKPFRGSVVVYSRVELNIEIEDLSYHEGVSLKDQILDWLQTEGDGDITNIELLEHVEVKEVSEFTD